MNRHLRRRINKEKRSNINFQENLLNAIKIHSEGKFSLAEKKYNELIEQKPGDYNVLRHLGILNQDQGKYKKAYDFYLKAIESRPNGHEAINNLGTIHLLNKNRELALKCFEKSILINPDYIPAINNLSALYHRLNEGKLSLKYAEKALALQPDNILTKNQYAKSLVLNNKLALAIKIFKQLVIENPDNDDFKINLSTSLRESGEIDKARKIINDGFRSNFKKLDYFIYYATDKKNNLTEEQINYYENLMSEQSTRSDEKVIIANAFFEFYRNKKNFERSGKFLTICNDTQFKLRDFDLDKENDFFTQLKKMFLNETYIPSGELNGIKPIFICGMPRSGTTLCEQILSTHSKISGAGELNELTDITGLENLIQTDKEKIINFKSHLNNKSFLDNARDQYLSFIKQFSKIGDKYVTDKLPHNFILIGFIKMIIPEAKIIYCKRDPIDNCFSLYTHKFIEMSHQYSYNQEILGKYYKMHENLMDFWLKKYNDIFILDNEELVNDQENVSRLLIKYCDLKWESQCLNFQDTKRQVRTASIEQVRQPINKKSIGAWRKYESYMEKLVSTLKD